MTYEVGMQVRVVAIPHGYCSPRIGDILTVTEVTDYGVMATTHMDLMKHRALGQGVYHLFFNFATIEPVVEGMGKTLKELNVKPGDIVGFKGADDDSWVVQEDFSVFSNQLFKNIELGEYYWEYVKGFKIISRAENTPTSETGTLKELDVKPGDVVEFISCEYNPFQYFYPEEPTTVTSDNRSSFGVRVYGIFPENDHAIWKVVSRAGETKSQKEEVTELKIGDKALVVRNTTHHGFEIGQIVTYDGVSEDCMRFKGSDGDFWYMVPEDFVKITEEDNIEVFYGFDGIGFFDVEHPCYDERLVLNHTTGTFTLERI